MPAEDISKLLAVGGASRCTMRVPRSTTFGTVLLLACVLLMVRGADAAQGDDTALREFQQRLRAYLDLRAALAAKLDPLTPTADAVQLASRQGALAAALATARRNAKAGDLVPAAAAALVRARVLDDFKRRTAAAERAVFSEVPDGPQPVINRTYPAAAALPTVPPLLLSTLPRLPDNLQYRFYGRHVVILDGDVQIIVDVIANVLPAH
jgi:hypothetical protein